MKKYWIYWVLIIGILPVSAQDLIIRRDESSLEAKVLRIEEEEVVFSLLNEAEKEYTMPKKELFMIAYASGMKQYFEVVVIDEEGDITDLSSVSKASVMYRQGMKDARNQYNSNGPLFGTMLSTGLFPPLGLVTGVTISAIPPRVDQNRLEDPALLKNPNYVAGYNRKLRKQKITSTSLGFVGGLLLFVAWVSIAST